jgi:hypothetical protein
VPDGLMGFVVHEPVRFAVCPQLFLVIVVSL